MNLAKSIITQSSDTSDFQMAPDEIRLPPYVNEHPDEIHLILIAARKKIGAYKGWFEHTKKRLQQERSAHDDEIRRIQERYRLEKEKISQQISQQLNQQHKQEIANLKATYEKKIAALKKKIIEQQRELALFRDQHSGKGQSEKVTGNSLDKNKQKDRKSKPKPPKPPKNPGRKKHTELPVTSREHDLPEEEKLCSQCGRPYEDTGMTEDSEDTDYRVIVQRIRHQRKKYKKSCNCPHQPQLKTAALPPKAMTKSKYTDDFWNEVILHKYYYQIPLTRLIKNLKSHGMENVKPGTLISGIDRYAQLFQPIDRGIIERSLQAKLWRADGSRFPVFVPREDKATYNWNMCQYQENDTIVFQLYDSKEAHHVQTYFAQADEDNPTIDDTEKTIFSDRDSVFKTLWFVIAFCWAHMRRDFIRVGRYNKGNRTWAIAWINDIRRLYRYYNARRKAKIDSNAWKRADTQIRNQVKAMEEKRDAELADNTLKQPRRKVLNSLKNHWHGLTRFVDDLNIPMDNNWVERMFRLVANFRKACYGVRSEKFGHITARFLTIFTTLDLHNINVRHFLEVWLEAVAANAGNPPENVDDFLPWSMSDHVREQLQLKRQTIRDGPA